MNRLRHPPLTIFALVVMAILYTGSSSQALAQTRKIVVLPFEFVDNTQGEIPVADKDEWLAQLTVLLKEKIREKNLYQIVEGQAIDAQIRIQQSRYDLRDCNGCDQDIAKVADADLTAAAWIQMVSALILSVTIEIRDGTTSRVVARKSAGIQGNTLSNWKRGVRYVVRRLAEDTAQK